LRFSWGVRLNRPQQKLPWYLFAAGLALNTAGDVVWDVYELGLHQDPFPSAADAGTVSGALLVVIDLTERRRARDEARRLK